MVEQFCIIIVKKKLWALECPHDIQRESLQGKDEGSENDQQTVSGSQLQSSSSSPDGLTSQKSYKPFPTSSTEVLSDLWIIF